MTVGRRVGPFFIILLVAAALLGSLAAAETGFPTTAEGESSRAGPATRRATAGVLDLRDAGDAPPLNLRNDLVSLDGFWEFYWNVFLPPSAFEDPVFGLEPLLVPVPGGWKDQVLDGAPLPGEGFGTYRLRVLLPADVLDKDGLALYVPYVRTSHRLFVNGRPVAERGVVGTDRASSSPAAGTEVVSVSVREPTRAERKLAGARDGGAAGGEDAHAPSEDDGHAGLSVVDIVLHVSNFHFRDGGLGRSLVFGTEKNVRGFAQRSLTVEMFLAASLLVIGLYHLGMWAIRPHDRHFLSFALFCLLIALRNSVMDQAPLTLFLPNIPWEILLKIEYAGYYLSVPLVVLFLHHMYPEEYDSRVARSGMAVGAAFTLFVVVTPGRINSHLLVWFHGVTVVLLAVIVGGLVVSARRNRPGARVILGAAFVMSLIVIHDILFFLNVLGVRGLVPVSVLGMVGAYSFVLSKKFSDEFEHQRLLMKENANLLRTVNEQIAQIKDSRRLMTEREERTRREVAEMLHGSVQSRLLSAQHHLRKSLGTLEPLTSISDDFQSDLITAARNLRKAGEQIAAVNEEEIRRLSHLLHPMLLRIGLVPALQSLADRFSEQLGIELITAGVLADGASEMEVAIPEALRLAMYRIVEEALTNVLKHARAQRVSIEVAIVDDAEGRVLTGIVADDGAGMGAVPGSEAASGFGMRMIAARVEEAGGTWSVRDNPRGGTVLQVWLPLPEPGAVG